MRRFLWTVGIVWFTALCVSAQETPRAEIFGAYSYIRLNPGTGFSGSNLNGGGGSVAYNVTSNFGLVADFGVYKLSKVSARAGGTTIGIKANATLSSYLFGPRFSYRQHDRVTPFAQVLLGGAHLGDVSIPAQTIFGIPVPASNQPSENAFAMSLGGGVDVKAHPHVAIRLGQVEFLLTRFNDPNSTTGAKATQKNLRISAGIVIRVGRK